MSIVITAFERSPDGGKGLARDTRVRWALEEVGQPAEVRPVSFAALKEPAHLRLQPVRPDLRPTRKRISRSPRPARSSCTSPSTIPASCRPTPMPARARSRMFAAVNTVEPPILELVIVKIIEGDKPWAKDRMPLVADRVRGRLRMLAARLGDAEWRDGAFSAGDLMMVHVVLRARPSFSTSS